MAALNDIQIRIVVQGTGIDNVNKLSGHLGNLGNQLGTAGKAVDAAKGKWEQFGRSLGDIERNLDAVFRAASHLQALGHDLTGMGEAGLGFLKESVNAWGDYEFAIHRAAGALGIFDTTTPIFHNLQRAVDQVSQEVRLFPAEEVARAVYLWGSTTGQTVKTQEDLAVVTKGLIPIMQAAAITESDYEKAIKGVYQILVQYDLGLGATADITEKLMLLTQKTALEFPDLIEAFKYTGTLAPELGVKFEDLAIIMGRVGDMGIRGSMSGRAFGQMFSKLVAPTQQAKKRLDEVFEATFGVNKGFNEMIFPNGEFIGMAEYVDILADALEDLTQKERSEILAIMTTQNEMRVMVPLINEQIRARAGLDGAIDMNKYSLANASETFAQTVHLLEQSWVGTMGLIQNTIGPIFRLIGSAVAEMVTPFLEGLSDIFVGIKQWLDTHPQVVKWMVQIIAVGSVLAIVAGTLFTVVGVLLAFGAGLVFVWQAAASFLGIFTGFLPILSAVVVGVTALIAIFATDFGGIRTAIEHVISAVMKLLGVMDFSGGSMDMLTHLGNVVLPVLEVAARAVAGVLEGLAWAIEKIAESEEATQVVQTLLSILLGYGALRTGAKLLDIGISTLTLGKQAGTASRMVNMLRTNLIKVGTTTIKSGPSAGLHTLTEVLKSTGGYVVSFIAKWSGFKAISGIVASVASKVSLSLKGVLIASGIGLVLVAVATLYQAWTENWGGIQEKVGAVIDWVSDKLAAFGDWIGSVIATIKMHFINIEWAIITTWRNVTTTIRDAIAQIIQFFIDLPTNISTFLTQVWTNVTTWVGNMVATITSLPGQALDAIVEGFNSIVTWLGEWWTSLGDSTTERIFYLVTRIALLPVQALIMIIKGFVAIWEWFVQWWEQLTEAIGKWVSGVVTTIVNWISKLPGKIAEFFGQVWKNLSTWWNNTIYSVGQWVTRTVNTILDWIGKLPGRIAAFFGQVWSNVSTWWNNFISAVGTWASNTLEKIISFISKLPGRVADWFGKLFRDTSTWFTVQFIPNIGTWASNAVKAVVKFFMELPGKIVSEVSRLNSQLRVFFRELPGKIWNTILSTGRRIIEGIGQGISNAVGWLKERAMEAARGVMNAIGDVFDFGSPSKVMMKYGELAMEGFAIGIEHNTSAIKEMYSQAYALERAAHSVETSMGTMSGGTYEWDGTRRIELDVRVSSPDGTVNNAARSTLEDILTAEDLVSSLEHMATVG